MDQAPASPAHSASMTARKPATLNRVCGDAPILIDCVEQRFALTLGVRVEIEGVLGLARRGELGARRGRLGAPGFLHGV